MNSPDSSIDNDDEIHHCKKCNKLLEEGRAFELGGNRWHVDCFRCSSCERQLDCDTNLLVLENGSLICTHCSYHCFVCQKKIEDLAILTGDLAFCSSCFKCRNCKKQIEDLRYARTSQGIFCIACHQALLSRKRKARSAANGNTLNSTSGGNTVNGSDNNDHNHTHSHQHNHHKISSGTRSPISNGSTNNGGAKALSSSNSKSTVKDKNLPMLPNRIGSPLSSDTSLLHSNLSNLGLQSQQDIPNGHNNTNALNSSQHNPLNLPHHTSPSLAAPFKPHRRSTNSPKYPNFTSPLAYQDNTSISSTETANTSLNNVPTDLSADFSAGLVLTDDFNISDNSSFGPSTLNPMPKPLPSPVSMRSGLSLIQETFDDNTNIPDFLANPRGDRGLHAPTPYEIDEDNIDIILNIDPRSSSNKMSGRDRNSNSNNGNPSISPYLQSSDFANTSITSTISSSHSSNLPVPVPQSPVGPAPVSNSPLLSPHKLESFASDFPMKIPTTPSKTSFSRSNFNNNGNINNNNGNLQLDQPFSTTPYGSHITPNKTPTSARRETSSYNSNTDMISTSSVSHDYRPKLSLSPKSLFTPHGRRGSASSQRDRDMAMSASTSTYQNRKNQEAPIISQPILLSSSTFNTDYNMAPYLSLPKRQTNPRAPSPLLEPNGHIIDENSNGDNGNIFHKRSFSDQPAFPNFTFKNEFKLNGDSRTNGNDNDVAVDDPHSMPSSSENQLINSLRISLQESNDRVKHLETLLKNRHSEMEGVVSEKRKTIANLEASYELTKRKLSVLDSVGPLGFAEEYSNQVGSLKDQVKSEIAELMTRRDELVQENLDLAAKRDKAIEETTALNMKNNQLALLNNEITRQLTERYNTPRSPSMQHNLFTNFRSVPSSGSSSSISTSVASKDNNGSLYPGDVNQFRPLAPGLGFYGNSPSSVDPSSPSYDDRIIHSIDAADQVVDRKHFGRPSFWKRPGQAVAKGAVKGFNKVFANELGSDGAADFNGNNNNNNNTRDPPAVTILSGSSSNGNLNDGNNNNGNNTDGNSNSSNSSGNSKDAAYNGNTNDKADKKSKHHKGWFNSSSASSNTINSAITSNAVASIMGVDIQELLSIEDRKIPLIVTRCIEEVEKRGLEFEGIYRKSGGMSQILSIQEAFSLGDEDKIDELLISDECDISAITSAVKQYLRMLPEPLIPYDLYESFIMAVSTLMVDNIQNILSQLPISHYNTLEYVMRHLNLVQQYAESNLMTSRNLAVVFAPTLIRDMTGEREIIDMGAKNKGMQFMIENFSQIFI